MTDPIIEKLIEAGLGIVRCKRGEKAPDGSIYDCTTTDAARVAKWLSGGYNVGATVLDNRILHIDCDPRHGGTFERVRATGWPKTWSYLTGRGDGGVHLFYRWPKDVEVRNASIMPGIDIMVKGKQGVLPPSIHPITKKPYQWIADPTVTPLADAPAEIIAALTGTVIEAPEIEMTIDEADYDLIRGALTFVPNKDLDYHAWMRVLFALKWAACRVSETAVPSRHAIANKIAARAGDWSRQSSKFEQAEHDKCWRHAKAVRTRSTGPVTILHLYNLAITAGWTGVPDMTSDEWVVLAADLSGCNFKEADETFRSCYELATRNKP